MAVEVKTRKLPDGEVQYIRQWLVPNPKGVVVLVHGVGEHCSRYDAVATLFNDSGYAMIGFDKRGHGHTTGKRGVAMIKDLHGDITAMLAMARELYPASRLFLYGHSGGGNEVLNYIINEEPEIKGVVASAPWIRLAFEPPKALVVAGRILRYILPNMTQPNDLDTAHLARNPAVAPAYEADPLVHDQMSFAYGIGMVDEAKKLNQFPGKMAVPTLVMHGSDDQITSAEASAEFVERVNGKVYLKIWEGLYHEIHNEKEMKEVVDFAIRWMERQW